MGAIEFAPIYEHHINGVLCMAKVAVISKSVKAEVGHLIAELDQDFMKNTKTLVKVVNRDKKFSNFLNGDDEAGLKAIVDPAYREKVLSALTNITDVPAKQALVIKMLDTEVDSIVASKISDVTKGLVLNDTEKALLAERALKFRAFVKGRLLTGIKEYAKQFGAMEYVEQNEPALATAQ